MGIQTISNSLEFKLVSNMLILFFFVNRNKKQTHDLVGWSSFECLKVDLSELALATREKRFLAWQQAATLNPEQNRKQRVGKEQELFVIFPKERSYAQLFKASSGQSGEPAA